MNLLYFIRLLLRNAFLIIGVGALMGIAVFVATRNQPDVYTSTTTVYTGIATGYNLESGANSRFDLFSNNAKFDNLINIIKSRETQEKTAIRLMAQHLLLTKPDPAYCLPSTWRTLMSEVPVEIKRMVELSYLAEDSEPLPVENDAVAQVDPTIPPADSLPLAEISGSVTPDTIVRQVERFRTEYRYYTIKAGDSPNTVCQKFGLTQGDLERLNSPMPPFQGGRRLRVGVTTVPYWEDSVVVNQVPAIPVTESAQTPVVDKAYEPATSDSAPADMEVLINEGLTSKENQQRFQHLVEALTVYKDADQDNFLANTLQSSNPFYSVQKIAGVRVTRVQSSDLLKLTFESNDPAVGMQTLKILTNVFKTQYQSITAAQTSQVSDYFRMSVASAKRKLDSLEQDLLHFRMKNRIINYDEQTKFISEQKETLDRDWYAEAGKYSAAQTAVALVEDNLGEKGKSILQNSSVLEKRKKVYQLATRITMEEMKDDIDIESLTQLKGELERLKLELNDEIIRSFELNRTVQGLNIQSVLQKWLEKAVEVEESHARFNKLTEQKSDFLKKYDEFAPLGSQLKKIEREINLAQQDYMNHLHNLNQSIMKQKNVEQSDIQIIDNPVYPLRPNASKRMFTVIAAFMAGLVLTAALIIFLEFIDSSIKFPGRFEELSGLKLIGAFPRIPEKPDHSVNYPLITSRAIDQIVQRIRLQDLRQKERGDQPFILFTISTREKEGKTRLTTLMVEKLRATGSKVLFVKPAEQNLSANLIRQFTDFSQPQYAWDFEYLIPENFITVRNINDLLRNYSFLTAGYHYIIIELPALLTQEYPATLTHSGNLSILIGRATRTWNKADEEVVKLYQSSINHPVMALLNGCQVDQLEGIIGEIPKRRTLFRKLVKRIINLNFKTSASS